MKVSDFSVVDLFCGVGGLTHGFVKEKFKVDAGIDFDETCKYAFEENNNSKFFHEDITKITSDELVAKYTKGKRKILVGCAPCQPFSIYNRKGVKKSERDSNDEKWKLLYSFADLVDEIEPEIISMENVPQLLKFNDGKVFNDFVKRLEKKKYFVTWNIVNYLGFFIRRIQKKCLKSLTIFFYKKSFL